MELTKVCIKCEEEKPIGEFRLSRNKYVDYTCKECRRIEHKEYNQTHKKERIEYMKTYKRGKNPKINKKKWKKSESGKAYIARYNHNTRVDRRSKASLTAKQWNKIIEMQNNKCNLCGCKFGDDNPPTRDHIIPASKGGNLTFENTQALCNSCNATKRDAVLPNLIQSWLS